MKIVREWLVRRPSRYLSRRAYRYPNGVTSLGTATKVAIPPFVANFCHLRLLAGTAKRTHAKNAISRVSIARLKLPTLYTCSVDRSRRFCNSRGTLFFANFANPSLFCHFRAKGVFTLFTEMLHTFDARPRMFLFQTTSASGARNLYLLRNLTDLTYESTFADAMEATFLAVAAVARPAEHTFV